jgi:UV excision repair protein RAD23
VGAGGNLDFSAIQNQPQIQHLRQMMQQNPALIQPILQELAAANPQLAQLFAQNPEALAQILGVEEGDLEGDDIPEGAQVIQVTQEESAAIQRVCVYMYRV